MLQLLVYPWRNRNCCGTSNASYNGILYVWFLCNPCNNYCLTLISYQSRLAEPYPKRWRTYTHGGDASSRRDRLLLRSVWRPGESIFFEYASCVKPLPRPSDINSSGVVHPRTRVCRWELGIRSTSGAPRYTDVVQSVGQYFGRVPVSDNHCKYSKLCSPILYNIAIPPYVPPPTPAINL